MELDEPPDNPLYHTWLESTRAAHNSHQAAMAHFSEHGSFPPFSADDPGLRAFDTRRKAVMAMAWAVPTQQVLSTIEEYSPNGVVEMGAGTGYWAGLLRKRGVDVVAYDEAPHHNSHADGEWSEVLRGGPEMVRLHPNRTLLLCWPPFWNGLANQSTRMFLGDTLVYVGEGSGGCTGGPWFHQRLDRGWDQVLDMQIPQWDGLHDSVMFYRRRV